MESLLNRYEGLYLYKDICRSDKILFTVKSEKKLSKEKMNEIINEVYDELVENWDKYLSCNGYESIEKNDILNRIYLW